MSPEQKIEAEYEHVYNRGDGTYVALHRLMFHWTMIIGLYELADIGYEDRYCYADEAKAIAAAEEWKSRDWAGEPTGWHRHPKTCRRRTDGDPAQEYIAP